MSPRKRNGHDNGNLVAGKMMSRYLQEVRTIPESSNVGIGRLPGFPPTSDDPDVVDKAIVELQRRIEAGVSPLKELHYRQRVMDMQVAVEWLREAGTGPTEAEEWFVANGAAYCHAKHFSYAALREMGVPA